MLYYYLRGERAKALDAYEGYRHRLAEEMGLSPSPQTEELHRKILEGTLPGPQKSPLPDFPAPYSLHLPFVGREAESAQLRKYLQDAQAGHEQLVLLRGEPGVGKTRLAQEVLQEVRRGGALVLWGRCREDATESPHFALAEAIRNGLFHLLYEDLAPIRPVWLAEIGALVPELHKLRPALPQNPPLTPRQAQQRLFEAMAQFLWGLAQSPRFAKPLVLWLDDLQWATPALLELLKYLCHRIAEQPICVVGAYRSTEVTAKHPLHQKFIKRRKQSHHVMLPRLSYSAIEQLLAQLGLKCSDLCRSLYNESMGNPLFMTVMLRSLLDRKIVTVTADGRWVCQKTDTSKFSSAQELGELIQQRLARLSLSEQRLLQLAAVLGTSFSEEFVKQLWGRSGNELSKSLSALCDAGLLAIQGPGLRYEFAHDRFREIVYDGISSDEKRLLHRRVAQAIERCYGPNISDCFGQLAFHYDRAQEWQPALRYSLKALEQAHVRYHHDEALRMAEIALRAAEKLAQPHSIFKILLRRIEAYHQLGRRPEQERDLKALFKLKNKLGKKLSASLEIEAYRARAVFCRVVGCYSESVDAAQQMLTLLHKTKDRSQEAKALLLLGTCHWALGQYARALESAQRARRISHTLGDHQGVGDALHLLGQIHAHTGALRQALRCYQGACRIRCETGDQPEVAYSLNNIANTYRALGNYQKALEAYNQSLVLAEEIGDEQRRGVVLSDLGDLYGHLGDYERSLQYAKEAHAILKSVRDPENLAQNLMITGRAHQGMRQLPQALKSFQRGLVMFERLHDVRGACHALDEIGAIELELSRARHALQTYQLALSRLQGLGTRDLEIECLMGMSYAYLRLGQKARALTFSQRAIELLETSGEYAYHQRVCFVHHLALQANDHHAKAKKYLQKAHEELLRRAQSIRDRALRESFLSRVGRNREIIATWCKQSDLH
jgi:predicted ATPase